jgi:DNA modification methylase
MDYKLYNDDCINVMRQFKDNSIDLVLTDPPYGIGRDKGSAGFGVSAGRKYSGSWDKTTPSKEYFDEILRISKMAIIFGGNYFSDKLPPSKSWIVWDKKCDINFKNPFADCELIWTNCGKVCKKYGFKQQGFITDSKDKRCHATQKPTELIGKILNDYSESGITVLDPFMGSGSTGVACANTGRNFIGIELDKNYFDIARSRIECVKD